VSHHCLPAFLPLQLVDCLIESEPAWCSALLCCQCYTACVQCGAAQDHEQQFTVWASDPALLLGCAACSLVNYEIARMGASPGLTDIELMVDAVQVGGWHLHMWCAAVQLAWPGEQCRLGHMHTLPSCLSMLFPQCSSLFSTGPGCTGHMWGSAV
jgi:hypothetical protein